MMQPMRILDAFRFHDGHVVILTEASTDSLVKGPVVASLMFGGVVVGNVVIESERLPAGEKPGRSFETRSEVDLTLLRSGNCWLRLED